MKRTCLAIVYTIAMLVLCVGFTTFAQDATTTTATTPEPHAVGANYTNCLWLGGVITIIVSLLKQKVSFVAKYPKVVASIGAVLIAGITPYIGIFHDGSTVGSFILCVIIQLLSAVGGYEIVLDENGLSGMLQKLFKKEEK